MYVYYACLRVCVYVCMCICVNVCICVYMCMCACIYLSIYLSVCLSIHPSIHPSLSLSLSFLPAHNHTSGLPETWVSHSSGCWAGLNQLTNPIIPHRSLAESDAKASIAQSATMLQGLHGMLVWNHGGKTPLAKVTYAKHCANSAGPGERRQVKSKLSSWPPPCSKRKRCIPDTGKGISPY